MDDNKPEENNSAQNTEKNDDVQPTSEQDGSEPKPVVKPGENEHPEEVPTEDEHPESEVPTPEPGEVTAPEHEPDPVEGAGKSILQEKPTLPKKGKFSTIVGVALLVLVLVMGALAFSFQSQLSSTEDELAAAEARISELDRDTRPLPASAVKVSECIPNMGFHYMAEGGNEEQGPFYLVNNDGEVIGVEFMFSKDQFVPIEAGELPVSVLNTGPIELNDWQFKSVDATLLPEGHDLFFEEHYDIHLYTVTPEVQATACE